MPLLFFLLFFLLLLMLLIFLFLLLFFMLVLLLDVLGLLGRAHSLINYQYLLICYIKLMNFESGPPFDLQLARLLAMVIMCEKNIEEVRKKMAGNQQFHTSLIFQRLDFQKKGQITPEDMVYSLSGEHPIVTLANCQSLCRKYTLSGAITYEELLALVTPKTDKSLSQRMLIRTTKRGATLPNYLWKYFTSLLISLISMATITEQLRRKMQNCADLNHLEMVAFFRMCLKSEQAIWNFCNGNSEEEYDFGVGDVRYLSNHVRSGNPVVDMTDQDIKELICPLDMNFQKTVHEMAPYYENIKIEKQKTEKQAFFQQTKWEQMNRKANSTNFLNSSYRPFFPNPNRLKENEASNYGQGKFQDKPVEESRYRFQVPVQDEGMLLKPSRVMQGSNMYLDNFIKPIGYESQPRAVEINGYINGNRYRRSGYERFDDPLEGNSRSSESNSAFIQY